MYQKIFVGFVMNTITIMQPYYYSPFYVEPEISEYGTGTSGWIEIFGGIGFLVIWIIIAIILGKILERYFE